MSAERESQGGEANPWPLADIIREVGFAVAEGQRELDHHALATQFDLQRGAEEGDVPHAFDTPWYRYTEVEADLKLVFGTHYTRERSERAAERGFRRPSLVAAPPDARDRRDDVEMAGNVRFRIVPVPPEMRHGHRPSPTEPGENRAPGDAAGDGGE